MPNQPKPSQVHIKANPLASADDLRWLRKQNPLSALAHPNCPPDLWWELAAKHPDEAQASVLYQLVVLESPESWAKLEKSNLEQWINQACERLTTTQQYLFAADCAERVLYVFEQKYPEDWRPRESIRVSRLHAQGNASVEQMITAQEAAWAAVEGTQAADWAALSTAGDAAQAAWNAEQAKEEAAEAAWRIEEEAAEAARRIKSAKGLPLHLDDIPSRPVSTRTVRALVRDAVRPNGATARVAWAAARSTVRAAGGAVQAAAAVARDEAAVAAQITAQTTVALIRAAAQEDLQAARVAARESVRNAELNARAAVKAARATAPETIRNTGIATRAAVREAKIAARSAVEAVRAAGQTTTRATAEKVQQDIENARRAAWSAAQHTERKWQWMRLRQYLRGEPV